MRGVRRMRRVKAYHDRLKAARAKGRPPGRRMLLQWHITERCNNRCIHCYQDRDGAQELNGEQLVAITDQFCDLTAAGNGPPGHINLTGGEPFVRDDIWELLEEFHARRDAFSFAVLTNGSFLDAKAARRLASLGPRFVQVSIDGDEATHDSIRGPGDFKRISRAIGHLGDNGTRTLISFTATRRNYRCFGDVAKLGMKLGVSKVWTDRFIPCGGSAPLEDEVLSPGEVRDFFSAVLKIKEKARRNPMCRTEIAMDRALQFLAGGGEPYRCAAGDTLITVMANGDVVPCRRMPVRTGNVLDRPLTEIYRESPLFVALRDRKKAAQGCGGCFYERLCGGGLRCLSYALTGDPFRKDPGCYVEAAVTAYAPEPAGTGKAPQIFT